MSEFTKAEQLLYSTVKLESFLGDACISTATGFLMNFAVGPGQAVPCIVTNKHAVDGSTHVRASLHFAENGMPSGKFANCVVDVTSGSLIHHPDASVDLCAIPFGHVLNQSTSSGKRIFYMGLNTALIPSDQDWATFDAIEEIIMVGCPNGITDEANNLPIVRRGITASSLGKRYNSRNEFMIDIACFPGSSGSPVFIYDRNGYFDRKQSMYMMGASRLFLVGVLFAGPQVTNEGEIVLSHTPTFSVATMMHLGYAIRADELRVLESLVQRALSI